MSKGQIEAHVDELDGTELDDDSAEESEDFEAEEVEATTAPPRPRAKRAAEVSVHTSAAMVGPFGVVPMNVSHWRIKRQGIDGWKYVGWAPPGALAELTEFPLSDLSEQTISDRWGPGLYDVSWVRHLTGGGRKVLRGPRGSSQVRILPQAPALPVQPRQSNAINDHLEFMGIVEQRAKSNLSDVLELARYFGEQRQPQGGLTLDGLRLLMRDEREATALATAAAIKAAVEPLQKQIAELSEEDEEEDEEDALGTAARTVGPRIFKGNKWWQQMGQLASENPELVKSVLPVVAGAVQSVASAVSAAVSAPVQRPRAVLPSAPPPPPQALHGGQPSSLDDVPRARTLVPPVPPAPPAPRPADEEEINVVSTIDGLAFREARERDSSVAAAQ